MKARTKETTSVTTQNTSAPHLFTKPHQEVITVNVHIDIKFGNAVYITGSAVCLGGGEDALRMNCLKDNLWTIQLSREAANRTCHFIRAPFDIGDKPHLSEINDKGSKTREVILDSKSGRNSFKLDRSDFQYVISHTMKNAK